MTDTQILPFNDDAIAEAARLISAGESVAVATETVYGLAGDATNAEAVARIYEAKGRPGFNPLIVHVPDLEAAEQIGVFDDASLELAKQHWPGPLTLVVPLRPDSGIASIVTAGLPTIGLRVPAHPAMQALLKATGRPLAAPSANSSGSISPTRAEHVLKSLGGRIKLIVDSGPTERGLESTIVAATGGPLRLLRPGPIEVAATIDAGSLVEAPGQLASHYSPAKPLRLNAESCRAGRISDRLRVDRGRLQPQPVGRFGCGGRAAFRLASPGRCVAQASHCGCARAWPRHRRRDQRPAQSRRGRDIEKGRPEDRPSPC